jgi:hypothetical protein
MSGQMRGKALAETKRICRYVEIGARPIRRLQQKGAEEEGEDNGEYISIHDCRCIFKTLARKLIL